MRNKLINKKAQSETVGFVLIIVIVAVILIIFLWFLFSSSSSEPYTSTDMSDLLTASMLYTTNCSTSFLPVYKTGQELLKECYNNGGELCLDGRTVCQAFNDTIKETIAYALDVNEDSPNKAFKINISFYVKGSTDPKREFYRYGEGDFANCSARFGGDLPVRVNQGSLDMRLQVCQSIKKKLGG